MVLTGSQASALPPQVFPAKPGNPVNCSVSAQTSLHLIGGRSRRRGSRCPWDSERGRRWRAVWLWANSLGNKAIIHADHVNNHYYLGGQQFATEAAFNTAAGIAVSGITRTVGPYVAPAETEKLTNGTFDTDATGWTAENSSLSVASGELVLTGSGSANPSARQDIATVDREAYVFKGSGRRGTMTD